MPEYVADYDISTIRPAEYNPRYLSEEAFTRLKNSINTFGLVKPIIANGDGTIVAGHQRQKALLAIGVTHAPVMVLDRKATIEDEIHFNLVHNSVERAGSTITVPPTEEEGWVLVPWQEIEETHLGESPMQLGMVGELVVRYGAWGSAVADPETGRVFANTDYAAICRRQRVDLLTYYPPPEHVAALEEALAGEFGVYDASKVMANAWQQHAIQPDRHEGSAKTGRAYLSTTYETLVMPSLDKETRFVDFGAGKQFYVKKLRAEGYKAFAYEPFLYHTTPSGKKFNLPHIVRDLRSISQDVRRNGLYPLVVLDSVLNASSNEEYHLWITLAAMGLLATDGRMVIGTRSLEFELKEQRSQGFSIRHRFLTPEGRSVAFRNHQWTSIRFHTSLTLKDWLERYFEDVTVYPLGGQANLRAEVRGPKPMPEDLVRQALDEEFNMAYPGDYRHNQHRSLAELLVAELKAAGRLTPSGTDLPEAIKKPPLAITHIQTEKAA